MAVGPGEPREVPRRPAFRQPTRPALQSPRRWFAQNGLGGGVACADETLDDNLALTLFILAVGVAAGAVVDHRHKNARMGPANVASWYCHQRGLHCEEPQAEEIEGAWQQRERVYRDQLLGLICRWADGARTEIPAPVPRWRPHRRQWASTKVSAQSGLVRRGRTGAIVTLRPPPARARKSATIVSVSRGSRP